MADELQIHLQAKDDLTRELKDVTKNVAKLEAALRDATEATSPDAERDIERLSRSLDDAYDDSRKLGRAIDNLDRNIEQLGGSARETGGKLDRMGRTGTKTVGVFGGVAGKGAAAAAAITAVAVAAGVTTIALVKLNNAVGQYQQNVLKSEQVFGRQLPMMRKWAKRHRDDFGGSTQDVLNYAASVQDLIVPMGFQRKEATGMTKDIAGLIPVLTAWDTKGRDSAEITEIIAAALTGEREALKSLGVTITEEQVKAQVELMRSQGRLTNETEEQSKAMATLELITAKTSDAQETYANNTDTVARRTKRVQAQIAQLRDNGLKILLEVWNGVAEAFRETDLGEPLKALGRFLRQNKDAIAAGLLDLAGALARGIGWVLKWAAMWIRSGGQVLNVISTVLRGMSYLDPRFKGAADKTAEWSDAAFDAAGNADTMAENAFTLADNLHEQANGARDAQKATNDYNTAIKNATKSAKKFLKKYRDTSLITSFSSYRSPTGDTSAPWGSGPGLGAAGLAAAHHAYASQLGGHQIVSGLRSWGLGSSQSDHLRGRAMDVKGPRLGSYAQAVRRAGGYAAFHGSGSERHLHVVPQTRRQAATVTAGGDTYRADVTVNGARSGIDIEAAVARGLRTAARQKRERG